MLLAAVAACSPFRSPDVEQADLPDGWSLPAASTAQEPWWQVFGDEPLNAVLEETLSSNLDVRAAAARIEQAEAATRETRSRFWPTVDASLGYSRARVNAGPPVGAVTQGTWSASLVAAYEVDAFGRYRHGAAAAALDADAARHDLRALQLSVAAELVDAWIELRYQAARRVVLERQLAIADAQSDLTAARFAYGLTTATELLAQEQQLESFRAALPQVRAAETLAANRIAVLRGMPPGSDALTVEPALPDAPVAPAAGVPADLLRARPDVVAAEARAIAAERRVAAAVAERLPMIRLSGTLGLQSNDLAELLDGFVWNAAISLVQPIFDGGRRRAAVQRAEGVVDERLLAYRRTLLVALREVEDALARESAQREVLGALEADHALARESLAVVQRQYALGAAEFPRVVAAEALVARTELALLDGQRALLAHYVSLGRALGAPWATSEPLASTATR